MLKKLHGTGGLIILFIIVFAFFTILNTKVFLSLENFQSMAFQIPEFGILSLAITITLINGGIDLSIISTAVLTAIVSATVMDKFISLGSGDLYIIFIIVLAILAGILISIICGTINGFLVSVAGISPIIVTLGTSRLFEGFSMVITKGHAISDFPKKFLFLGGGTIFELPVPLIIFGSIALLLALLLNKTPLGFSIYMVGSNPVAATFSGLNNRNVIIKTYIISGILSGIAGIIILSKVNSIKVGYGSAYLLRCVLVAILGGVDPKGGFGSISGVISGVFILQIVASGLNIMGVSQFFRNVVWGLMLIIVMIIKYLTFKYRSRVKIELKNNN